jgi:hypothetical protein
MSFGMNSSSQEPKNVTPPELAANYAPFSQVIQSLLGSGKGRNFDATSGIPKAPGPFTAPMGPEESASFANFNNPSSFQGVGNYVQSSLANQGALPALGINSYVRSALAGDYLPGANKSNPFLQGAITAAQRPTQQALQDTLSRSLPGQFAQAGQFAQPGMGSSAFDMAAATAYGRGANAMGDIATNISSNAYGQERQLMQEAGQLGQAQHAQQIGQQLGAAQLGQAQRASLVNQLQANALPRMIQQQGISTGLQQFQQNISNLLSALGLATGQSGMSNIGQSGSSSGFSIGIPMGGL